MARTKAFREKKAKKMNEKKAAKLEAAKLFVYNVDKVILLSDENLASQIFKLELFLPGHVSRSSA